MVSPSSAAQVDVDSIAGMKHLNAVLELREAYRGVVDIQIVACMEYPLTAEPEAAFWLGRAVEAGADLVGGIPEVEPDTQAKIRHIQMVFDVAQRYGVDIDMHIDETADPNCRTLELLADATIQHSYQGRVTAGHCCALSAYDSDYAQKVIEKVALARIHVITNPLTNLYIQGRNAGTPTWRGITRVKELLAAGVNVSCGLDDNSNFFLPFGKMNMLEVALFTSLAAQMTTPEQLQTVFDMPRQRAARILGLQDYGFAVGKPADFIILPVDNSPGRYPPRPRPALGCTWWQSCRRDPPGEGRLDSIEALSDSFTLRGFNPQLWGFLKRGGLVVWNGEHTCNQAVYPIIIIMDIKDMLV